MFPHFLKEREISSSPPVFASSCFVSFGSGLGLVFFWFGLVLHGGRGAYRGLSLSFGCMFVGCRF